MIGQNNENEIEIFTPFHLHYSLSLILLIILIVFYPLNQSFMCWPFEKLVKKRIFKISVNILKKNPRKFVILEKLVNDEKVRKKFKFLSEIQVSFKFFLFCFVFFLRKNSLNSMIRCLFLYLPSCCLLYPISWDCFLSKLAEYSEFLQHSVYGNTFFFTLNLLGEW